MLRSRFHVLMEEADDLLLSGGGGGAPEVGEPLVDEAVITPTLVEEGWLQGIDQEIANDPSLQHIKDVASLAKSYVHGQRMIGSDKVVLPGDNSTPEDWKSFYGKLGLPENGEAYEMGLGEDNVLDEGFTNEFKEMAFGANLLPNQVQEVMKFYNSKIMEQEKIFDTETSDKMTADVSALKEEWGEGFDKKLNQARTVIQNFGDEKFFEYLKESGLVSDTRLTKFLANIGSSLNEDSFSKDAIGHLGMTKDEAQTQINTMMSDMNSPYNNSEHLNHANAVAEMQKLFTIIS